MHLFAVDIGVMPRKHNNKKEGWSFCLFISADVMSNKWGSNLDLLKNGPDCEMSPVLETHH